MPFLPLRKPKRKVPAMPIPTQTEMFLMVLELMKDGKERKRIGIINDACDMLGL